MPRRSASLAYTPCGHFHFRQSYKHLKHTMLNLPCQSFFPDIFQKPVLWDIFNHNLLPCIRLLKGHTLSMESKSCEKGIYLPLTIMTIQHIPHHRVPHPCHVNPDLMGTPCCNPTTYKRIEFPLYQEGFQHFILCIR